MRIGDGGNQAPLFLKESCNETGFFSQENVGACALGDACGFSHILPMKSRTVLVHNMYYTPDNVGPFFMPDRSEEEKREHFERFYEDVFVEMSTKYGRVVDLAVAENLCDHLVGSVWVLFDSAASAERAVKSLNTRWFAGRPLYAELCPVSRVEDAKCVHKPCFGSPFCNYLHVQEPPSSLVSRLFEEQDACEREDSDLTEPPEIQPGQYEWDEYDDGHYPDRNGGPYRNEYGGIDHRSYGPYGSSTIHSGYGQRQSQSIAGYNEAHFRRSSYTRNANYCYDTRPYRHRLPADRNRRAPGNHNYQVAFRRRAVNNHFNYESSS